MDLDVELSVQCAICSHMSLRGGCLFICSRTTFVSVLLQAQEEQVGRYVCLSEGHCTVL